MFFKNYNDNMDRMFCTKIKFLARKTVLQVLLFQIIYKCRVPWSLEINRCKKIVNLNTNWTKKTIILSKCHLIWHQCKITRWQCQLVKNIDISLCMLALYTLKTFGPYTMQLGIYNYMYNFLKNSL